MIRHEDMRIAHLQWQIGIFRGYEAFERCDITLLKPAPAE